MKVKQLRLLQGCYALKGGDNVTAGPTTTIEMIGGGNVLVKQGTEVVFIPNGQVHFAKCEPDAKGGK
jgi:hypothetical protein